MEDAPLLRQAATGPELRWGRECLSHQFDSLSNDIENIWEGSHDQQPPSLLQPATVYKCPVHVCAEWSGTRSHRNTPAAASASSWPPHFPSRSSSVISDGTSNGGTFTSSLQASAAPKHFSARVLLPRRFGVCGQWNIRLLQQRCRPQRDPQKPALETPKCRLLLFKSHLALFQFSISEASSRRII